MCERYNYTISHWRRWRLDRQRFAPSPLLRESVLPMHEDMAAVGVSHICGQARARGQRVLLSGSGADEYMSDYGFQGRRCGRLP